MLFPNQTREIPSLVHLKLDNAGHFYKSRNMEKTDIIASLAALAHDTRLDIFRLLVVTGPGGLAVGEIGAQVNVPPATLNHHLAQMKQAGLVTCVRDGRKLIHSADFERMDGVLSYLTDNCCQGDDCAPTYKP